MAYGKAQAKKGQESGETTGSAVQVEVGNVKNLPTRFSSTPIVFSITDMVIAEIRETVKDLKINGVEDKEGYEQVKAARLKIVRLRGDLERSRKEQKQEALDHGRNLDTEAGRLRVALETIEAPLKKMEEEIDAIEKAEVDRVQREKEAKHKARKDAAAAVGVMITTLEEHKIIMFSDEDFDTYLATATEAYQVKCAKDKADADRLAELEKQEADRKAEADAKAAKEKADEDERLRKQKEKQDADQKVLDDQAKALADQQAELKRQQDKLDNDREDERLRKEVEEKAAADLKAKAEKDAKAKADREEKERKEKAEAEALRPDKEKLAAYFDALRAVPVPELDTEEAKERLDPVLDFLIGQIIT